jgi:hypothetical protein
LSLSPIVEGMWNTVYKPLGLPDRWRRVEYYF